MGGAGRGRPEEDDLVGLVSARLLAAGTPRRERLHALSLLGLLFDHADAGGKVRVPLDDLVGEFELPRARVEEALEALVQVGAVRRGPERLVLVGRQPPLSGSLRLTAFLANVAVVLDDEHAEPVPAAPARSPVFLADATADAPAEGGRRQRRLRPRQPALAALALTGVVLLAALGPSSPAPTRLRSVGGPPSATTSESASGRSVSSDASEPETDPAQQQGAGGEASAGGGESSASPAPGATERSTVPGQDRRPGDQRPAAAGTEGSTGQQAPPAPESRRVTTPPQDSVRGRPPPPSPVGPSPAVPAPAVSCPAGAPRIEADSIAVVPAGPDVVGGVPATSVIEVRGSLVNPTPATAVIRSFEVTVRSGASTVAMPSTGPLDVGPDGRREWTVRTPTAASPATPPTVEGARIVEWGWQDAQLARSCPI